MAKQRTAKKNSTPPPTPPPLPWDDRCRLTYRIFCDGCSMRDLAEYTGHSVTLIEEQIRTVCRLDKSLSVEEK
jgi:hypothetical protein